MSVVVVDYGSGNLRSAAKACERAARDRGLNLDVKISGRAEDVRAAERIVLPGQGAFGDCKRGLAAVPGMIEALSEAVIKEGRPFLGICVGMQLMAERGLEHGVHQGLGWLPGDVVAMAPADKSLKIPHMGWNELVDLAPHPVLAGLAPGCHAYFVHSYIMRCAEARHVLASCDYGGPFAAIVGRDNMVGTQFHVEKSQATGLTLIGNFLAWRP
ncbi:MAG TPA: imidazole glycerol phosphate synthase subunit HisH [Alphaproteobacteria bacterium]|jgi:glutamine amidotransferase